ncbi:hypothetical protein ACOSQ3_006973 [Xanthoceras sorbifolium]
MQMDTLCKCCSSAPETAVHVLWQCSYLKVMRHQCYFLFNNICRLPYTASFIDFFILCCSVLNQDNIRLLVVILCRCWYRRNLKMHENILLPAVYIVAWCSNVLHDFDAASCVSYKSSVGNKLVSIWFKPPANWVKINCDAALRSCNRLVGLGAVIHDTYGCFLAGVCRKLDGLVAVEVAEATTVLHGVHLAI